ncbi:hypothetical protein STSP_59550 [Streptomyces jeddahensis]|uniref:Uncharacterized protein n=1 Tax=Streptomyces jeddahensis TaxID=1716141 RepID=A0A177HIZ9_9ACTN|nr:hypothetical protein STSP_59550 [Streptomyces jeddahensis]
MINCVANPGWPLLTYAAVSSLNRKNLSLRRQAHHARRIIFSVSMAGNDACHAGAMPVSVILGITASGKILSLQYLPGQIGVATVHPAINNGNCHAFTS